MTRMGPASRGNQVRLRSARLSVAFGLLSGAGAAAAGATPTGLRAVDATLVLLAVLATVWSAASAPWWLLISTAAAAAALAPNAVLLCVGLVALAIPAVIGARRSSWAWARALSAGLTVQVLARAGHRWVFGCTAAIALLAGGALIVLGVRRRPTYVRRRAWRVALVAGGAAGVCTLAFMVAALTSRAPLQEGDRLAHQGLTQLDHGDLRAAAGSFRESSAAFARAATDVDTWWTAPARLVPVVAQHRTATVDLSVRAAQAMGAAADALDRVDIDRLRVVDGRIDLAAVRELAVPFAELDDAIGRLEQVLGDVRSGWLVAPVQRRLASTADEIHRNERRLRNARQAVEVAPAMLGEGGVRRYFVAFVTPSEVRGLVGFMGNWAEITVTDGHLEMTAFGSDEDLNRGGPAPDERTVTGPADFVENYGRFGLVEADGTTSLVPWKNITVAPDLPMVAQVIAELYPQSGGRRIDGVFVLDPSAIASLLRFTGPIRVDGLDRPLNANTAQEFIERGQYELPQEQRLDLLEVIARSAVERLLTSSLPAPTELARTFGPVVAAGGMMAWSPLPAEEALFTGIGMDGSFESRAHGAPVVVVADNAGANKIDAYATRTLTVDGDTVTIDLANAAPGSGLPAYVIGNKVNRPDGTNYARYTLYTEREVASLQVDGADLPASRSNEFGRFAYTFYLAIDPASSRRLTVRLVP